MNNFNINDINTALVDIKNLNECIITTDIRFTIVLKKISSLNEISILRDFVVLTLQKIQTNDDQLLITPELLDEIEKLQSLILKIKNINNDIRSVIRDMP